MSTIQAQSLQKSYGSVRALKGITLHIPDGAFFFLLGPSGCGKSTLLRLIAGLETPDSGLLTFDGEDAARLKPQERNIGMVFQSYALWPHMTVYENVEFGLLVRRIPREKREAAVCSALDTARLMEFRSRYPSELSGGQQQRVALARALAISPRVILLDEPLSNLDTKLRIELRSELRRIHRETGVTMIYVTHDQSEALSLGTEVAVMRDGEILQTDSPGTLLANPADAFVRTFLSGTALITAAVLESGQGLVSVQTRPAAITLSGSSASAPPGSEVTLSVQASIISH